MKPLASVLTATITVVLGFKAGAQIYDTNVNSVHVFAGSGERSYLEGMGAQAMFTDPSGGGRLLSARFARHPLGRGCDGY